jgi:hypothetical protein
MAPLREAQSPPFRQAVIEASGQVHEEQHDARVAHRPGSFGC